MTVETKRLRPVDRARGALRAHSGLHRTQRGRVHRDRQADDGKGFRDLLREAPGVTVIDHRANEGYVTPHECAGEDAVFISRIRRIPPLRTAWCSGASRTIFARARH